MEIIRTHMVQDIASISNVAARKLYVAVDGPFKIWSKVNVILTYILHFVVTYSLFLSNMKCICSYKAVDDELVYSLYLSDMKCIC